MQSVGNITKHKFSATKIVIDSKSMRNLAEKWNEKELIEIITISQKELIYTIKNINKTYKQSPSGATPRTSK